jgi:hypothetical protein
MASAGEDKEVLMAAIFTFHASKAVVQIAAIEIAGEITCSTWGR